MACFQDLPDENIAKVFAYLGPLETLKCRRVSQSWRQQLLGCAALAIRQPASTINDEGAIQSIHLKALRCDQTEESQEQQGLPAQPVPYCFQSRTKGHLPSPRVLTARSSLSNEKPIEFCARNGVIGLRLEDNDSHVVFDSLDLSISSCLVMRPTIGPLSRPSGSVRIPSIKRTKPLFKRILLKADLSSVIHLKRVSLRGCSYLQTLSLPPGMEALDVSSCTALVSIRFPLGYQDGNEFEALNLRGCRSLVPQDRTRIFGLATDNIMRCIQDLDFSSTKLPPCILEYALAKVTRLESLSLRYLATDGMVRAFADSAACKETLRFLDVSFSGGLGDEAVEALIASAPCLERLNLRACTSISSRVYNGAPGWLERGSGHMSAGADTHNNRRKGDLLFNFLGGSK